MKKSQRSTVDLSYIDPPIEAGSCLKIARANGGIDAMREIDRDQRCASE